MNKRKIQNMFPLGYKSNLDKDILCASSFMTDFTATFYRCLFDRTL